MRMLAVTSISPGMTPISMTASSAAPAPGALFMDILEVTYRPSWRSPYSSMFITYPSS